MNFSLPRKAPKGVVMGLAASAGMAGSLHAGLIATGQANVGPLDWTSFSEEESLSQNYAVSIDANNSFSGDITAGFYKDSVQLSTFTGLQVVSASNGETIGAATTGWNTNSIEVDDDDSKLVGLQLSEPGNQTLYGWMQISSSSNGGVIGEVPDIIFYTEESANFSWDVQTDGSSITVNAPEAPAVPAEMAIAAAFLAGSALLFRRRQKLLAGSALE